VDDVIGRDEGRCPRCIEKFATLGPERLDILKGDGGIGLVDRVEGPFVAYVFLGN